MNVFGRPSALNSVSQKTLKLIGRANFEVELIQKANGPFLVRSKPQGPPEETSLEITDYHTALFIFDMRVQELEGH